VGQTGSDVLTNQPIAILDMADVRKWSRDQFHQLFM